MCDWLLFVEDQAIIERSQSVKAGSNLIPKIRTIAAVTWLIKDDPILCDKLQNLITEEKFRYVNKANLLRLDVLLSSLCGLTSKSLRQKFP